MACARVLAMPAWGLEPSDLVRLIERAAKSKGGSLWDTMQAAQGEPPFSEAANIWERLSKWFLNFERKLAN